MLSCRRCRHPAYVYFFPVLYTKAMIIAITGPAGSGKSTVSSKLAKKLPKCVNIEVDHVKHFIVGGFKAEKKPDGSTKWEYDQWPLCGDSIGLLANNFKNNGYDVIINGYMDEAAWKATLQHVQLTHKFVLLPHLDTVIERDAGRAADDVMGEEAIREHHDDFTNNPFYKSFDFIDSTVHSIDDTVKLVAKRIEVKV